MTIYETMGSEVLRFFISFNNQVLILELMFCFLYKKRKHFFARFIPSVIGYCSINYIIPDFYFSKLLIIGGWFNLSFAIYFFLSLAIIFFCFDIPIGHVLFFGMAAYAMQNCADNIYRIGTIFFGVARQSLQYRIIRLLVSYTIFVIFWLVFRKRVKRGDVVNLNKKSMLIVMAITLTFVYVLSMYVMFIHKDMDIVYKIYGACCCILLLIVQFGLFERSKIAREKDIIEQILHIEKKQQKTVEQNIELINLKCHDLKKQIATLRTIQNKAEQDESIRDIERAIIIYDSFVKTGNKVLDAILTEKAMQCEKHTIKLGCLAEGSILDFMQAADIYSLFENLLDNAIESVIHVSDKDKRIIGLNVSSKNELIIIHTENYFEHAIVYEEGLPLTTKEDKIHHGYGVRSIKHIAEKYGGVVSMSQREKLFNVNVIIPTNVSASR